MIKPHEVQVQNAHDVEKRTRCDRPDNGILINYFELSLNLSTKTVDGKSLKNVDVFCTT